MNQKVEIERMQALSKGPPRKQRAVRAKSAPDVRGADDSRLDARRHANCQAEARKQPQNDWLAGTHRRRRRKPWRRRR